MSAKAKLLYLPIPIGRILAPRLAMALTDFEYDYEIMEHSALDELRKTAHKVPFGQLPVLNLSNGDTISQGIAIMNYVADKGGMSPKDPLAQAEVMSFVLTIEDVVALLTATFRISDANKKKTMRIEMATTKLPPMLAYIDSFIAKHGKSGNCYGDKPSVADCYLTQMVKLYSMPQLDDIPKDLFQKYTNISKAVETLCANPKVKTLMSSLP
eukprot:CAMPEP_0113845470 /NCGR_PEP_ID=MMETSP0372-20130328/775_1 /TAXON_ID=340204 /ORGANISM="Lankesteria abbotti" /LENGTH=211 /DNA_ID=CAMNT_0000814517 /DNA_START=128 /DNA_END=763 /DNA_ORIENTATION=+ /assembly_acc=CAM_ASM_000359